MLIDPSSVISFIVKQARKYWTAGHERTLAIKKNIIYIFFIRGVGILVTFLLVPLTIHYINAGQYGVWLTISSMVIWINNFDIGLSNGLRNKMAHSLAVNDHENTRKYISTTYAILFCIASFIFVAFYIVGSFFNWNQLLNITGTVNYDIWPIIIITLGSFCIRFFLQPISSILTATQQPFKSSLIQLLGQILTLIAIYLLTIFTKSNLVLMVIAVSMAPVIVFLLANIYVFVTHLRAYAPRLTFIDLKSAKSLFSVGGIFFIIQIGILILMETDNIILSRTLGPQSVTVFNVAFKYFSLGNVLFIIMVSPYWSAFTDAYAKNDMEWIREANRRMQTILLYMSGFIVVLYFFSGIFYQLWVGQSVTVPGSLSLSMMAFIIVVNWQSMCAVALNGIGKLRLQLILVVTTSLINIPLSVWLIRMIGINGTVIANIILMGAISVVLHFQVKLILSQKATGIWNK